MVIMPFDLVHLLVMISFCSVPEWILLVDVFVLVALVVVLMVFPEAQTDPAEFMSTPTWTLLTGHVVAALVLFYILVAFRAWFCVDQNPIHIFTFIIMFINPLFWYFTIARFMVLLLTIETEIVSTLTLYFYIRILATQISNVATIRWTVTLIFLVIYKALFEEILLFSKLFNGQIFRVVGLCNFTEAPGVSRTSRIETVLGWTLYFVWKILN